MHSTNTRKINSNYPWYKDTMKCVSFLIFYSKFHSFYEFNGKWTISSHERHPINENGSQFRQGYLNLATIVFKAVSSESELISVFPNGLLPLVIECYNWSKSEIIRLIVMGNQWLSLIGIAILIRKNSPQLSKRFRPKEWQLQFYSS